MGRPTVEPRQGIVVASADDIARAIIIVLGRPELKRLVGETLAEVVWSLNQQSAQSERIAATPKEATTQQKPQLIGIEALAKRLDVTERHLFKMRKAELTPKEVDVGGCVRWDSEVIEAWIKAGCPARVECEVGRTKAAGQGQQTRRRTRERSPK
jgi:predicted DNA-binding transcriptional regulator AlpA